ncbi:MDR family MFS transporter [Devosia submarina]|uniref:MDR family MFS transporter n=1 Tax=Devosia submarina TaxID=1173082 RepID=UPI000D3B9788|nr:MDR family MFS transporter [Devosia submarina]
MSTDATHFDASLAGAPPVAHTDRARNKLVIALLLVSTFVVFLNETIMSVAIPHLMVDLGVSAGAAQWLTTGFLLTMAVVIPITGFLLQVLNTRPIFLLAMSVFTAGTLLCAVSPGLELLIIGRVVQAVGTAIMMPLLMTTVMTLVPPEERGRTMGNTSIVMSVAPAIGPTIGGFILAHFEWRWMFLLVLPIAIGALMLGFRKIQNVSTPRPSPLDVVSVILSAFAFGGLIYGLSSFGESFAHQGEPSAIPLWLPIAVGVVAMVAFVWRQLRLQADNKALLDLRVFRSRTYAVSVGMMLIAMMALFGTIILLPIYTQNVVGLDTLQTGLLLLPGGLIMGIMGPIVGRLYDRVGPTVLAVPGAILVSAVLWALTTVGTGTSVWALMAGHMVLSVGLALIFTPVFTSSMGSVRKELYSHASAILGSVQQLAGAAGIALFIALMTIRTAALTAEGLTPVEALAGGIRSAFLVGAIISLGAIVAAFFIRKPEGSGPAGHGGH